MQIFFTSKSPVISARNLDDKRANKQILESAQIMSTVMHLEGFQDRAPYRATHKNHPITKWVAKSYQNFIWCFRNYIACSNIYSSYSDRKHKSSRLAPTFLSFSFKLEDTGLTEFPNCSYYKNDVDVLTAYKKTLLDKWSDDTRAVEFKERDYPKFYSSRLIKTV